MNPVIKQGRAVPTEPNAPALPNGVEYEQLVRDLKHNTEKKYDGREDLRSFKKFSLDMIDDEKENTSSTFMLIPGSSLINYENGQHDTAPRPVSDGPWKASDVWIGK